MTEIWYEVNEYAGKAFFFNGLFILGVGLAFMFSPWGFTLIPRGIIPNSLPYSYFSVFAFLGIFVLSLLITLFVCIQRAKAFTSPSASTSIFDNL